MCISHTDKGFTGLSVALSSRIVIDTLLGFLYDDLWHGTEAGVQTINEARQALRYTFGRDSAETFYNKPMAHFKSYDEIIMLRHVVEEMKWDSWDSDLEQWLMNIEKVKDYFSYLESYALSESRHAGGCF